MNRRTILIAIGVLVVAVAAWFLLVPHGPKIPKVYTVEVANTYPHDADAFTEGLFYRDGLLYEGTGEEGSSGIRKSRLETGEVLAQETLGPPYFGEGIVDWKDKLIEVTWKDGAGFVYNLADFQLSGSFKYPGEGWGLTHNDKHIIMSDGTPVLRFLDPETFKQVSTLRVTAAGCPVANLNELEWVDGRIYANIWKTGLIARIDPATGEVESFLDMSALGPHSLDVDAVANGIAYDAPKKRLFVTGKRWPQLYEVRAGAEKTDSDAAASLTSCAP